MALASLFAAAVHAASAELITAEDLGNDWPFTFAEGYVACHAGNAVTVMDAESGRMYPLNGASKGKARALRLDDLQTVWRDSTEIVGTKVSISAVIDRGVKLCL